MSTRVRRNLSLLKQLLHSSPSQRKIIIKSASKDLILTLCEIAVNILKGKVPLNPTQYQKLKKKRIGIRLFADKKVGLLKKKKKLLNQSGGFLLPLLSIAVPFITSLITSRQR